MSKSYRDKRLQEIRRLLNKSTDPKHAAFHKGYHKSSKKFYGLKTKQMTDICNDVFPKKEKLTKEETMVLTTALWSSDWFEEQVIGLTLLERIVKELTPNDLPYLKKLISECEGWAFLDWIATKMLGTLAMNFPDTIYPKVRSWTKSKHLWTRRAAILIHVLPARKKKVNISVALSTCTELLHEKEFFIRKAIGWTLREICKHYRDTAFEFLKEHRDEASGLTLREGGRTLSVRMRKELGLK